MKPRLKSGAIDPGGTPCRFIYVRMVIEHHPNRLLAEFFFAFSATPFTQEPESTETGRDSIAYVPDAVAIARLGQ
jgi:hypothetical protein